VALSYFHTEDPQILGATVPNLVTQATWWAGCGHNCAWGTHAEDVYRKGLSQLEVVCQYGLQLQCAVISVPESHSCTEPGNVTGATHWVTE